MEEARTQYTDLRGTAAADWYDPTQFQKLAEAGGVDTDRYFPVGLVLYGEEQELEVSQIYAVDIEKAGGNTFEAIRDYLTKHPKDVEVFDYTNPEREPKITAFVKRLNIKLGNRDLLDLI